MAALFRLWVPTAARLRRDELALTLCRWAGMTVEPARINGKCTCGQDLDPCGHHLQVCQHRASFTWCHQIWQDFFTNEAAGIPGVKVVTSTTHGLPHETTTGGKNPDAIITVPQPPGFYGPLLYPNSTTGTAGLTLDFTVVHPVGRSGTEYAWIRDSQEAGRSQAKPVLIHQRKRIGPRDLKGTHVGPLPLK